MLTSLDALIPKVLNISHDWRLQLLQSWTSIVGSLKTHMSLEHIYGSTIIIGVYDTHWAQELNGLSRMLLLSINKALGHNYVTQVKFRRCERREYHKSARPSVCFTQKHELVQPTFTPEQQRMLENITDLNLRKALVSYFARCAL